VSDGVLSPEVDDDQTFELPSRLDFGDTSTAPCLPGAIAVAPTDVPPMDTDSECGLSDLDLDSDGDDDPVDSARTSASGGMPPAPPPLPELPTADGPPTNTLSSFTFAAASAATSAPSPSPSPFATATGSGSMAPPPCTLASTFQPAGGVKPAAVKPTKKRKRRDTAVRTDLAEARTQHAEAGRHARKARRKADDELCKASEIGKAAMALQAEAQQLEAKLAAAASKLEQVERSHTDQIAKVTAEANESLRRIYTPTPAP